jgi:hypothetical protein
MTNPIEYPPLHPDHPTSDPSTDIYWRFYTDQERQMLLDTPIEDIAQEIALLRMSIYAVFESQETDPITDPQGSLNTLYSFSVASRTIGALVKYQRGYHKTHNKWDALYKEAMHIARIRTGMYRQMAFIGFTVPAGVLAIEPDLMPVCLPVEGWVPPPIINL